MSISVRNVVKRFGQFMALDNVSLEVPDGSLVALLGPSGSGKTTLLRVIAGLELPDEGAIYFKDQDASGWDVQARNIGFVFQHYALFRHQTIFDNIGFSLKMRGRPAAEIRERVTELLRLIQLENLGNRYPAQLSGGQRQRVALARALAARPALMLLDEPFGALDARVRQELRQWLRQLHEEIHVTSVFVTHDQEEALELADQVVILNQGRIEQVGTPDEVYHRPANPFVMQFLGQVNLFHTRVDRANGNTLVGYARPHELDIIRQLNGHPAWPARVTRINGAGAQVRIDLQLLDDNRRVEVILSPQRSRELQLNHGERVYVKPHQLKVFEADYQI
jgi:sulfate/thiosulfate transport system ATP-binding protein